MTDSVSDQTSCSASDSSDDDDIAMFARRQAMKDYVFHLIQRQEFRKALGFARKLYRLQPTDEAQMMIRMLEHQVAEADDDQQQDENDSPEEEDEDEEVSAATGYGSESGSEELSAGFHEAVAKQARENEMVDIGDGFKLRRKITNQLYSYQRHGVVWMWYLFRNGYGGILGDDMGLGKTIQIITFLSGLYHFKHIRTAMIIVPLSLLQNWEGEFKKWGNNIRRVLRFHGARRERDSNLHKVQANDGVILTTYQIVLNCSEQLYSRKGQHFVWDYLILDEGHIIKNSQSKTSKAVYKIPARFRLVLSGTPIQNNLKELWSLFNFTHQGTLLPPEHTFRYYYNTPITRGREKDASADEQQYGQRVTERLLAIIDPFFLRRTKDEVLRGREGLNNINAPPKLSNKNEFVVWIPLSNLQQVLYRHLLTVMWQIPELMGCGNYEAAILVRIMVLKKICDHPRLLTRRLRNLLGLDDGREENDDSERRETESDHRVRQTKENELDESTVKLAISHLNEKQLRSESTKLKFVVRLLKDLKKHKHRALIFSQSCRMLDIIQKVLTEKNLSHVRIDGTVSSFEREQRIRAFQKNNKYLCFLLTTRVGGIGLNLTGADRVIVYDPSWNPAMDAQAVDRVYRIGQAKRVVVYRLITCSTVEEKIYQRQIFKDSIVLQITGDSKDHYRYFTKEELGDLFSLDDPNTSATQMQLHAMHAHKRKMDAELEGHITFLLTKCRIFGLSDHDLVFSHQDGGGNRDDEPDGGGGSGDPEQEQKWNEQIERVAAAASAPASNAPSKSAAASLPPPSRRATRNIDGAKQLGREDPLLKWLQDQLDNVHFVDSHCALQNDSSSSGGDVGEEEATESEAEAIRTCNAVQQRIDGAVGTRQCSCRHCDRAMGTVHCCRCMKRLPHTASSNALDNRTYSDLFARLGSPSSSVELSTDDDDGVESLCSRELYSCSSVGTYLCPPCLGKLIRVVSAEMSSSSSSSASPPPSSRAGNSNTTSSSSSGTAVRYTVPNIELQSSDHDEYCPIMRCSSSRTSLSQSEE